MFANFYRRQFATRRRKIMQNISLPQKIEFKEGEEKNRGLITVEPCYPGYGATIGNAVRRVLISSLPGAAVVGVKIKGAVHEFMPIPHVKEDALNIILNLKKLRLKVHSDETVKLELDIHGEKKVTAADITKNSQVEIINPELHIADITDMAGSLVVEIFVRQGRGYETIESRDEKKHETGYIEMDSVFSPVLSVGISIENVRVGKMTNWDKLVLDVQTDGTITSEEAFNASVNVLIDQFNALVGVVPAEIGEADEAAEVAVESTEEAKELPIEEIVIEEKMKKRGRPKKS